MRNKLLLTLLALVLTTGGCSMFSSKGDKETVKLRAALEMPPDLARPAGEDFSAAVPAERGPVPVANGPSAVAASAPVAANGASAAASSRVRLERDGAQRWLVVQDAREPVWMTVREYFLRNEFKLDIDDPKAGVLETNWIKRREVVGGSVLGKFLSGLRSTGLRDKYRVRIESGRLAGTTEVYVSHQGLEEVVMSEGGPSGVVQTTWQSRPSDPEKEAEMLGKLMTSLGSDVPQAGAGAAAAAATATAATGERAQRVKDTLVLPQDDLDGAWRRVGQALDRAGVVIEDRDRSAGIYYVRYVATGTAAKKGVVFPWESGAGDSKDDGAQDRFQVVLKAEGSGTTVGVRNVKGQPDDSKPGERLLTLLHQQLR